MQEFSNMIKTKKDDPKIILLSGYSDSNTGPSGPKPDALANCATPRMPILTGMDCKYTALFRKFKFFFVNL